MSVMYTYIYKGSNYKITNSTWASPEETVTVYNGQIFFYYGWTGSTHRVYVWNKSKGKFTRVDFLDSGTTACVICGSVCRRVNHFTSNHSKRVWLENCGYLDPTPFFNCNHYSSTCHSASGGSHYGLRHQTKIAKPDGSGGFTTTRWIDSDHRVIIGSGQGHTYNRSVNTTNCNYLRCWGYIKPDGTVVETYGEYVYINYITNHPDNYALHTQ